MEATNITFYGSEDQQHQPQYSSSAENQQHQPQYSSSEGYYYLDAPTQVLEDVQVVEPRNSIIEKFQASTATDRKFLNLHAMEVGEFYI